MDSHRFDAIARYLAERRLSRRAAVRQGGLGLAAAALGTRLGGGVVAAQDATPHPAEGENPQYLFVQSFAGGSLTPKDAAAGTYTLALEEGLGETLYFSDRPDRYVGIMPTQQFLDNLGFTPEDPPNAALVARTGTGEEQIVVLELTNPVYDAAARGLTYDATLLADYSRIDMQFGQTPASEVAEAQSYGPAHLFIDQWPCGSHHIGCYYYDSDNNCTLIGDLGKKGFCINTSYSCDNPCDGWDHFVEECSDTFAMCSGDDCVPKKGLDACG